MQGAAPARRLVVSRSFISTLGNPDQVDMRAAKKKLSVDSKVLQELVPLNALSAERFREVADKIVIED